MVIQIAQDVSDLGVSIDIFKRVMGFQVKKGSKLVQGGGVPGEEIRNTCI